VSGYFAHIPGVACAIALGSTAAKRDISA